MFTQIFLFIAGFWLLLKGADILTDRAAEIAKRLQISSFLIGILIVGIGTSIPELIVMVFSNLQGTSAIGVGTIIGSNTFNILFILGVSAMISPLILTKNQVWRHLVFNISAVAIVALLIWFRITELQGLSRPDGFLLLMLFFFWMYYLYVFRKDATMEGYADARSHSHFSNLLFIVGGLIGIIIGGDWVTQSSVAIAKFLGMKESVIGLTIVGLGTSLPELSASAVAAYKKNYGIAVGNIIGSNIFDFLMILGLASAMKPIPITDPLFFDLIVTILSATLLFAAMFIGQKYVLKRWQGFVLVFLYIAYLIYLFFLRP